MKLTFEFEDNPKELAFKKTIKSFYKGWMAIIESNFEDEDEMEELKEFKRMIQMESEGNKITMYMASDIIDESDLTNFKSSLFSGLSK